MSEGSAIEARWLEVRATIRSVPPEVANRLRLDGALLVDTRPVEQRERFGTIPGAIVIDRNVLEWRLDPTSPHRIPAVTGSDQPIVILCQEGYSSVLSVASLAALGLTNVHDLAGGFEAWAAAGLPTTP